MRQYNGELEAEQRLSAGQNDTRLGQHLLDLGVERCARPFLGLAAGHCALLLAGISSSQSGESVPEPDRHRGRCSSSDGTSHLPENAAGCYKKIEPEGEREGEKRQVSKDRHQAVEIPAVLAVLDNSVIWTRRNQ